MKGEMFVEWNIMKKLEDLENVKPAKEYAIELAKLSLNLDI